MKKITLLLLLSACLLCACQPEVGSPAWCKKMEGIPKGDWTANEAADYLKYCILDQERD
jgi:hypothetical protein